MDFQKVYHQRASVPLFGKSLVVTFRASRVSRSEFRSSTLSPDTLDEERLNKVRNSVVSFLLSKLIRFLLG